MLRQGIGKGDSVLIGRLMTSPELEGYEEEVPEDIRAVVESQE